MKDLVLLVSSLSSKLANGWIACKTILRCFGGENSGGEDLYPSVYSKIHVKL